MESQTIQELEALTPTEMDAGLIFSGVPTGNKIWGYQNPCLYTPAVDPHYSFHESARDAAVWFMNKLDPLYLYQHLIRDLPVGQINHNLPAYLLLSAQPHK